MGWFLVAPREISAVPQLNSRRSGSLPVVQQGIALYARITQISAQFVKQRGVLGRRPIALHRLACTRSFGRVGPGMCFFVGGCQEGLLSVATLAVTVFLSLGALGRFCCILIGRGGLQAGLGGRGRARAKAPTAHWTIP